MTEIDCEFERRQVHAAPPVPEIVGILQEGIDRHLSGEVTGVAVLLLLADGTFEHTTSKAPVDDLLNGLSSLIQDVAIDAEDDDETTEEAQ